MLMEFSCCCSTMGVGREMGGCGQCIKYSMFLANFVIFVSTFPDPEEKPLAFNGHVSNSFCYSDDI